MVIALFFTPNIVESLRLPLRVRSGEIAAHESPRSVDRKTLLAATSSTPACVPWMSGVSQWKR